MDRIAASFGTCTEDETVKELFPTCEKISIDYAVMEKSDEIYVVEEIWDGLTLAVTVPWRSIISLPDDDPVPDGCIADSTSNGNKAVGRCATL